MTSLRDHERTEFPAQVRRDAFRRCCDGEGIPHCEGCGIELVSGNIVYEHFDPDGLGGEATLENCKVFCLKACARRKTDEEDNPRMVKADAVLRANYGLKAAPSRKIRSRGFTPAKPQRTASRPLERVRT